MKHNAINTSICAALLLVSAGCTDDSFPKNPYSEPLDMLNLFTATIETPGENGIDVNWPQDSKVGVFAGASENKAFTVKENMNTSAVFQPEDSISIEGPLDRVYAYYPYDSSVKMSGKQISVDLPSVQPYVADGPDPGSIQLVATGTTRSLSFKHAFAVVKVRLANTEFGTVSNVVLKSLDGRKLSGAANVSLDYDIYGEPQVTMAQSALDSVVVDCGESGVAITSKGSDFFFVVPAASYDDLSFFITNTDGAIFESRVKETLEVSRGKVADAGLGKIYIEEFFYGKANCIRESVPGTYSFDVSPYYTTDSYGYAYEFNTREDLVAASSAELLWQSKASLISGITLSADGRTVSFTANDTGNSLIGIFDDKKEVLWSFHVWIAPADTVRYPNGYLMQDRNLGALSNTPGDHKSWGLYYQWGRKDPFPELEKGSKNMAQVVYFDKDNQSFTVPGEASKAGVDQYWATKHPTTFIARAGNTPDWYWECGNNRLWGNPLGYNYPDISTLNKSIYDPCPEGYMVPPLDVWTANGVTKGSFDNVPYDKTNLGRTMTLNGINQWYPAASYYHNNYPSANANTNNVGRYWTSSPNPNDDSKVYGIVWGDTAAATYPEWSVNRAFGYSVRCVHVVSE